MAEQLQVQIGANIRDLQNKLAKATRQLDSFKLTNKALESTFKAGAISSDRYYKAIAKNTLRLEGAQRNIKRYKNELQGLGGSTQMLGKSTTNAVPALTSFSQVIQDAPYGIRGVANNITQLTSQMGYLSKSAGGTKAALKAMLGTLAGPAGILLVVSLVTSALVSFGDKLGGAKNKADALKKKLDELNDSFGIELGYNKEVQKSLKLQGKSITDNLNERKKIINSQIDSISLLIKEQQELINVQKEANEIVSTWELIAGTSGNAFQQYKSWWLGNFNKFKKDVKLDEYRDWWEKNFKKGAEFLGIDTTVDPASKAELEKQKKLTEQLKELETKRLKLSNQKLEIDKEITKEVGSQFNFLDRLNEKSKELIGKNQPNISNAFDLTKPNNKLKEGFLASYGIVGDGVRKLNKTATSGFSNLELLYITHSERMKEITKTSFFNAVTGLSGALAGAIANGGNVVQALGSALLNSFGSFLSQMGAQMALYGKLAVAKGKLDLAIAAGGPVAIAAGAAAIKTGLLIAAAGAAVSALASGGLGGGSVGGSGSSSSGNNFSSTSYGGGFGNGGKVIFEIAGDKLIGVLNNTSLGNLRVGDSDQLITTG